MSQQRRRECETSENVNIFHFIRHFTDSSLLCACGQLNSHILDQVPTLPLNMCRNIYIHTISMILFRAIRTISAECLKSKHLFKVSRHEGIHFLTIRNFTFIQPFLSTTKFVWCVRYNSICARLFRTFESSPQSRCWYRVNEVHS